MIHVTIRPPAPFPRTEDPEHVVLLEASLPNSDEKSVSCSLERDDVLFEPRARLRAANELVRLGASLHSFRPRERSVQGHPFDHCLADEGRWTSLALHRSLTEEIAERIRQVADHLRRRHLAPPRDHIRLEMTKAFDYLLAVTSPAERLH